MIKVYCDRCGKEIKVSFFGPGKEWHDKIKFNGEEYHICPDCYNSFYDWRLRKTK